MSMYLTEIQNYYQRLCEQHTDIQHGTNGITAFFRLQGFGALPQLPNNIGDVLVMMERFSGQAVGEYDANKLRQNITIRFAKYLETRADGDQEAAIDDCMSQCLLILFDFISRMRDDFNADSCGWLKGVDFSSISWSEFDGPLIENHYGWDMNIPFRASFPAYRPDKWI